MTTIKETLQKYGFQNIDSMLEAAAATGVPLYIAVALFEKESMGRNIYGHDSGGVFSVPGKNIEVTESNFKEFIRRINSGEKSNGVGPTQITWKGFFPDAEKKGLKLWLPYDNFIYGFTLLASYLKGDYSDASLKSAGTRYNGKVSYGEDFLKKVLSWKKKLETPGGEKKMGYTLTSRSASGKWNDSVPRGSITIHHWDDPKKRPTFEGTVSWLARPEVKASIHFVAEAGRVCAMVPENKGAWHAGNSVGNATSLSIECNPRMTDGDLETVAELIAYLRKKYGNLPLRPHKSWRSTSCPGSYEAKLGWLSDRADQINGSSPKPPVEPPATPTTTLSTSEVKALQAGLNRVFPSYSKLSVDGAYGPATTAVVREFQNRSKLQVDGIVGPATRAELAKYGINLSGATTPIEKVVYKVTAAALNARRGPGTKHAVVGSAPKGTLITGTGKVSGDWIQGQTPYQASKNVSAWYHKSYLQVA